ncbi:MAG: hypothetical protein E7251_01770 [Paenibacillaceae bacterium]|nr:hypothetical protein [Paenibacillaceae bacterium]
MRSDGSIIIDTRINSDGVEKGVGEIKSSLSKLGGTVKRIGTAIFAAFAVKQIVQFGKECLKLGSDLAEVQNVVDVTFPTITKRVDEFARAAADSFGLSETMAKKYVGTFGAMSKSFGYSESAAYDMATALTGLTGDVASFYNISQDEAYTKLKSVFTGETESLKELGVVMTQNALDQFALAKGFGKVTDKMTEQEKVSLRLQFVQEQLSAASGDFSRTSDSWANQVRILQLRLQSLKATIGQGFINLFTPIIKSINVFLEKLSVATTAFKKFTETIMGKTTVSSGMSQETSNVTDLQNGYEGAAQGAEDFANGVKDANKQVKKSLAPFDDLIQIQRDAKDTTTTDPNTTPAIPVESEQSESPFLNNVLKTLEDIKVKLLEIGEIFKSGFMQGLGNYKPILNELITDLQSIGSHLRDIFTDADVMAAAERFINSFALMVGQLVGSIASIGLTIATNLVGGMESYLSQNTERIKGWIVRMFNIGTEINTILGDFFVAFADVFSVFSTQTAQDITGSVIQIFADVFGGVLELTAKFTRDVLDMMLTPFTENKDLIKQSISETLEPIQVVVETIASTVRQLVDGIMKLYDEYIHPLFVSIREGLSKILKLLLEAYNEYIVPILDKLAKKFKEVMEGPVGDAIDSALKFLGKLVKAIQLLWEEVLLPFITWLIKTMVPILAPIIETIGNVFLNVFGAIAETISGVFDVLSGLIDFITGVFTGDWEKAWKGIKEIFAGIWKQLEAVVEAIVNSIIDIVNGFVKTVSTAIEKAIESFNKGYEKGKSLSDNKYGGGGRTFSSYSASPYSAYSNNVPQLATGTVVPPKAGNFLAMLGDNNRDYEVVSPLGTIKQAVLEALGESGGFNNGPINITMELDGTKFAQLVYKYNNKENDRVGVRMVTNGG